MSEYTLNVRQLPFVQVYLIVFIQTVTHLGLSCTVEPNVNSMVKEDNDCLELVFMYPDDTLHWFREVAHLELDLILYYKCWTCVFSFPFIILIAQGRSFMGVLNPMY